MKTFLHPHLEVRPSGAKGWGIFSTQWIEDDQIIEVSPVIILSRKDRKLIDQTKLHDYIFEWGEDTQLSAMAMGYVPIYNHACPSNAEYIMSIEQGLITIQTVRRIEPEAEIFINYQGDFDNAEAVWFDLK